ncbi:MAG: hypothetical protein QW101_04595 [Ignisphaera sp.]|uniref:Uncharacterized protein n=1 Tax=Ignisphaera aggregans TaxID=334771 RepID=A0A7J3MX21_9CREN
MSTVAPLEETIATLLSQPPVLIAIAIQFLLGLALGYISTKIVKYILAFVAILVLGTFLSIWSLGTTPAEVLSTLGIAAEAAKRLAIVLGLMSVGPVSIGFIVGIVIGMIKK